MAVNRPGIAVAVTQKHIKHYKTNAFLMISNFFYSTAPAKIIFLCHKHHFVYKTNGILMILCHKHHFVYKTNGILMFLHKFVSRVLKTL